MVGAIFVIFMMTFVMAKDDEVVRAKANIQPNCKQGVDYKVYGKVEMAQKAGCEQTLYDVKLEGLPPNTTHGFHVHEKGDIFSEGCGSTGGHYNPAGVDHGGKDDKTRHVGDLGNVKANDKGEIDIKFSDKLAVLLGKNSIVGRAFVVHALADDLGKGVGEKREGSLKTGNAGPRVACGIIYYA